MLLLNQSIEMNEFKREHNAVPFEVYEHVLEAALWLADMYISEQESNDDFRKELGKITGVKYYKN